MRVEVQGLDRCIKRLEGMKNELETKLHKLIERLGEIGVEVASSGFKDAPYDGERDATVGNLTWTGDNTAEIVASGRTVLFIEFGTGVHFFTDPEGYVTSHGYGPGTYGPQGNKDWWLYEGEPGDPNAGGETFDKNPKMTITHGNPASRPMYEAAKEMRANIEKIAREVFGK